MTGRGSRTRFVVFLAVGFASGAFGGLLPQPWPEIARLSGSEQPPMAGFGQAVALSGDVAIVGVRNVDVEGEANQGEAYIYRRVDGTWVEEQRLTSSDGNENDFFGHSAGIYGETAMVGAVAQGDFPEFARGAVYVFERIGATWVETQKLQASDGDEQDQFGEALYFDGERLLVGAHRAAPGSATGGAAYSFVFNGSDWVEEDKLFDPLTENSDAFGSDVALDGDRALIGARSDGDGSAYVFVRDGSAWVMEQKLEPSDPSTPSLFGWSVALWRGTAVVGAPQKTVGGQIQRGAVYVFTLEDGTWTETQSLTPPTTHAQSSFGREVDLEGGTLLAAGELNFGGDIERGVVYEYRRDAGSEWQEVHWFAAPTGQTLDNFGQAIDIDSQRAIFGNPDNILVEPPGGTAWILGKPVVFEDGFESGDTSAWDTTVP